MTAELDLSQRITENAEAVFDAVADEGTQTSVAWRTLPDTTLPDHRVVRTSIFHVIKPPDKKGKKDAADEPATTGIPVWTPDQLKAEGTKPNLTLRVSIQPSPQEIRGMEIVYQMGGKQPPQVQETQRRGDFIVPLPSISDPEAKMRLLYAGLSTAAKHVKKTG